MISLQEVSALVLVLYCLVSPVVKPVTLGPVQIGPLDLLLPVAAVLFVVKRKVRFPVSVLALTGFVLVAMLSVVWIQDGGAQRGAALRSIRLLEIITPLALAGAVMHSETLTRRMLRAFAWGGGISIVLGMILFAMQIPLGQSLQRYYFPGGQYLYRAGGLFGDSTAFGHLVATWFVLVVLTLPVLVKEQRWRIWATLAVLALSGLALYGSLSRGAFINIMAAWLLGTVLWPPPAWRKAIIRQVVILVIAGFVVIIGGAALFRQHAMEAVTLIYQRTVGGIVSVISQTGTLNEVSAGRIGHWQSYLPFALENPVTGIGYKALSLERGVPPDNNFLAALVETGVLGLLLLLAFYATVLGALVLGYRRGNPYCWVLLLVWTGQIVQSLTADIMTFWGTMPPLLAITGAVLGMAAIGTPTESLEGQKS